MLGLYAKAALTARGRGGPLPDTVLTEEVRVEQAHLARYARVCGFGLRDVLPPTYPHVLGFPLALRLMTDRAFPLPLPGLVHVRNVITARRPLRTDEPLRLRVHAERIAVHERGTTVDLVSDVDVDGGPVWQGRSTYLARGVPAPEGAPGVADGPAPRLGERAAAVWQVPTDVGRRYAAVSGDVNPIHLNPLAAKAFGFPRTIAHGMWSAARCLAALEGRVPAAGTFDVAFRAPLLLGSAVSLLTRQVAGGWDFGLRSDRTHLLGTVRA